MTDVTTAPSPASEATAGHTTPSGPAPRILLYSDDHTVREQVRLAVGPRISADAPPIVWHEVATPAAVVDAADSGRWDLLVLDGEADKAGGMGVCRQLKNELYDCPPVLVLTGRPQDSWLASWSQADDTVARPLDPITLQAAVAGLL
ncbi:response regulator transcription factor [Myceligenerans pegani]|uniref:Response regulator transcription factor n=1 Tax=Myceligenerans pegani TaxID=2776917 RepID=A0ABR9N0M8_9MICO|nr:response regulator transcription factor [Myceligenerans sp. TRM 65318]MBE1877220.1 response regulator transcription factor [Myceligenerans sp. TRM 65318]MBE3019491.1 response regulator transcription factor [Myceligenerans sp. TRM 65318]